MSKFWPATLPQTDNFDLRRKWVVVSTANRKLGTLLHGDGKHEAFSTANRKLGTLLHGDGKHEAFSTADRKLGTLAHEDGKREAWKMNRCGIQKKCVYGKTHKGTKTHKQNAQKYRNYRAYSY